MAQEVSTIARYIFPWLRWADPQQAGAAVDDLFDRYDIKLIGGSHCNPIRTDIPKYAEALREAMILAAAGDFEIVY